MVAEGTYSNIHIYSVCFCGIASVTQHKMFGNRVDWDMIHYDGLRVTNDIFEKSRETLSFENFGFNAFVISLVTFHRKFIKELERHHPQKSVTDYVNSFSILFKSLGIKSTFYFTYQSYFIRFSRSECSIHLNAQWRSIATKM